MYELRIYILYLFFKGRLFEKQFEYEANYFLNITIKIKSLQSRATGFHLEDK